jgi:hypothetical protein
MTTKHQPEEGAATPGASTTRPSNPGEPRPPLPFPPLDPIAWAPSYAMGVLYTASATSLSRSFENAVVSQRELNVLGEMATAVGAATLLSVPWSRVRPCEHAGSSSAFELLLPLLERLCRKLESAPR